MKNQRGVALSGLLFWGFIIVMVAVLAMKVAPTAIEYLKIQKDAKAVVAQAADTASVAEIKASFNKFAEVDQLAFTADQLDISKENGKIIISFEYEKRIPLFYNVSLLIDYKGSTANP
ncbi:MAG: hypothetical protein RLZZ298_966 [Pseudomonadota bacterium]|jgi:hypothetical protein